MRVLALVVSSIVDLILLSKKKRQANVVNQQRSKEEQDEEIVHYLPYHESPRDAPPSLAAAELAIYTLLAIPSLYLIVSHAPAGVLGWFYLFAFAPLRWYPRILRVGCPDHTQAICEPSRRSTRDLSAARLPA
ncbi:hypothetical protein PGQ11_009857 [Apiospora arundinis]|uniref:Uncharacterized protein n=1 Tax=Apiospora arundinis TaxID=335852 RepID=A0ABR2I8Q3_9PEZI